VDHLNETLAASGFHYTVQTWQPSKPEAHETELERWVGENQLDDCPFCPENWPNLYMMALPIHIGPYGMGRGAKHLVHGYRLVDLVLAGAVPRQLVEAADSHLVPTVSEPTRP